VAIVRGWSALTAIKWESGLAKSDFDDIQELSIS
jgi:hypothetical protein